MGVHNEKTHYKKTSNHADLSNILNKQIQHRVIVRQYPESPPVAGFFIFKTYLPAPLYSSVSLPVL